MKTKYGILLCLLAFTNTIILGQNFSWVKTIGGTGDVTAPFRVVTDKNKNIFIIGNFTGNVKIGSNTFAANGTDGFIAKLDSAGNFKWANTISSPGAFTENFTGLDVSSDGNFIVATGYFTNTCTFLGQNSTSKSLTTTDANKNDAFIIKYDQNGEIVGNVLKVASGINHQRIIGIKIDKSDKYAIYGYFIDSVQFINTEIRPSGATGTARLFNFIARLNQDGTVIWKQYLNGSGDHFYAATAFSAKVTGIDISDDAYYWTGYFPNTIEFNIDGSTKSCTSYDGNTSSNFDMFVYKTDLNGVGKFYKQIGGLGGDQSTSVSFDGLNNLYISGYFQSTPIYIDSTINGTTIIKSNILKSSNGGYDMFMAKYNSEGQFQWVKSGGGTTDDLLYQAKFGEGFFVSAGSNRSSFNFDGTTVGFSSGTNSDLLNFVHDNSDNVLYAVNIGNSSTERGQCATIDKNGSYIFVGDFNSSSLNVGGSNLTTEGGYDLMIVKYLKGSLDKSSTNVSCYGGSDGTIAVTPRGPLTPSFHYTWSKKGNPAFTAPDTSYITGLSVGWYYVVFQDAEGFTFKDSVQITQPASAVSVSVLSQVNVKCHGDAAGSVTLSGSGGTSPYTYNLDGDGYQSSTTFSSLLADTYTLGIKDSKGCLSSVGVTITEPTQELAVTTSGTATSGSNGEATASPSGGTSPYTYSWNSTPVQTAITATGLSAGTYTVTVTDDNLCTTTGSIGIYSFLVNATKTDITCNGLTNGSVTTAVTGGSSPFTYELFLGAVSKGTNSTGSFSGLSAGNYTITVTDYATSVASTSFTIIEPSAMNLSLTKTEITCKNYTNGALTTVVSGGKTPYTYLWTKDGSNFATTANISGLGYGTYVNKVTDKNGCFDSKSTSFSSTLSTLSVTLTPTSSKCYLSQGNNTGSLSSSVIGASGSPTYSWSTGATTANINATAGNTYYLTVKDALNCSASASSPISYGPRISGNITATVRPCTVASNGELTFTPILSGNGTLTYLWNNNQTSSVATSLVAGNYAVTVTDAMGCTFQTSSTLTSYALPTSNISITGEDTICNGNNTLLSIALTGASPWNVTYYDGTNYNTLSSINSSPYALVVAPSATKNYSISATSDAHCSATNLGSPVKIVVNPRPTSIISGSTAICDGLSASINIALTGKKPWSLTYTDGTTPVTVNNIVISPYTFNISPSTSKTYTVTALSDSNCVAQIADMTGSAIINVNQRPTSIISSPTSICEGKNAIVSIALTGSQPWNLTYTDGTTPNIVNGITTSPYTFTIAPSSAVNYSISTLADANCTAQAIDKTGNASITVNANPIVTTKTVNANCFGSATGSAIAQVVGNLSNYSFSWNSNPVQNNDTAFNLIQGNYTVIVTDNNSCITEKNVTINQPSALSLTEVTNAHKNITCYGVNNGSLKVSATGSSGKYQYSFNNGSTWDSITQKSGLAVGKYKILLRDSLTPTCIYSGLDSIAITQPLDIIATISKTDITCYGKANGFSIASATGGTGNLTYSWSAPLSSTNDTVTNLSKGNYSVTITDANGCQKTVNTTISEPDSITSVISKNDVTCKSKNDGLAVASATGGTGNLTFKWDNNIENDSIVNLKAGSYSVTITDANGCKKSLSTTLSQPDTFVVSLASKKDIKCYNSNDGILNIVVAGGISPITYKWSNDSTSQNIKALKAGKYSVIATDKNSCTAQFASEILQPDSLSATTVVENVKCNGAATGIAIATAKGGSGNIRYIWNDANQTANDTLANIKAGLYSVTVLDDSACSKVANVSITEPDAITLDKAVTKDASSATADDGSITIAATGGTGNISYTLTTGNITNTSGVFAVKPGNYTVNVTDANGCGPIASASIVVNYTSSVPGNTNVRQVSVYPNPNKGNFKVEISDASINQAKVEIFNLLGVRVHQSIVKHAVDGKFIQNVTLSNKGVYIIKVNDKVLKDRLVVN